MDESFTIIRAAAPLRQQVLTVLRDAIIDGRLAPGQRLTERELTTRLGVSRTVLRESLRQLEAEGLINLIPNKGPVVRALTAREARELYRIREMLEGLAARLFAENADAARLAALDAALAEVVAAYEAQDPKVVIAAKNRFYKAMHAGADSGTLREMLATVLARIWRWRTIGLSHPDRAPTRSEESVANLRAVVEAIRGHDGASAEERARNEARLAAAEVLRLIGGGEDAEPAAADARAAG